MFWAVEKRVKEPLVPFSVLTRRSVGWGNFAGLIAFVTETSLAFLLVATLIAGVANLVAIVGFMVTVTPGVPDQEQGLATGLATMSQQVGITMDIPIMSAIVTATVHADAGQPSTGILTGLTAATGVNAVLCHLTAFLAHTFLRKPGTSNYTIELAEVVA
ncbi:hypothetical protein [Micromonospora sp. LH3U1]|uniref:hypothetical protein n=1 Tax=Micromonospora sp. LH3U1 TaxID=3018339 RepID=UPI00234B4F56|nr:hypothetical protein [Micromonospora sp. LH3U1]WCN79548.1 hypothetical protein PCA76_21330 [Micromonospora sp. LH3U1]